jgi:protease IV
MSLETETVLDRRHLRRRLSIWRIAAIVSLTVTVGAFLLSGERGLQLVEGRQIARVSIEGMITESRDQLRLLERVAEANHVQAVILFLNSPGGTTTGGEALFEALRKLSEKKPVVAQFGTIAASAAYLAGLGADHIVAHGNTITGSVGVIMQWPEVTQLLDKIGVKMNELKSGPLKANPSPFRPLDEPGRELTQHMIAESHRWFIGLVSSRRSIATSEVPGLEQGRVFSGREALTHRLVDQIGGEAEAVKWLEEKRNVRKGLKVVDWKLDRRSNWWLPAGALSRFASQIMGGVGGELSELLTQDRTLRTLGLDGLVSVWQPSEN